MPSPHLSGRISSSTELRKNAGRRQRKGPSPPILYQRATANCQLPSCWLEVRVFPACLFFSGPNLLARTGVSQEIPRDLLSWDHDLLTPSIAGRQKPPVL